MKDRTCQEHLTQRLAHLGSFARSFNGPFIPRFHAGRCVKSFIVLLLTCTSLCACPYAEKMANAIYIAEGGAKTKYPYGVKSIKPPEGATDKTAWARKITLNSIQNNWKRWEAAGKPEDFVKFMARRWCPESADPQGHVNWVKNVNAKLKQ